MPVNGELDMMAGRGNKAYALKFTGATAAIAALPDSLMLRTFSKSNECWDHLTTTWFDAPDRMLKKQHLQLRLRQSIAGRIQTIKRRPPSDPESYAEYEIQIDNSDTFPKQTGVDEIDSILKANADGLVALAETKTDRWTAAIHVDDSTIELSIDLGFAASISPVQKRHEAPLARLSLHLISGDPADMYGLGRLLAANAPIRIAGQSTYKFAGCLGRGGPYAVKRYKLSEALPAETAAALLQRTLYSLAMRMARLHAAILDARKPEAVHQMRVALRRFRAIERIFRPYVKSSTLRALARQAQHYGRLLAPLRDGHVFIDETVPSVSNSGYAPDGFQSLSMKVIGANAAAWAGAMRTLSDPAFTIFLINVIEFSKEPPLSKKARRKLSVPAFDLAPAMLDRRRKKVISAAKRVKGDDPVARHELRKQLKKLRYPAQLFKGIAPGKLRKPYMAAMAALQDRHGVFNDAADAHSIANDLATGGGANAMRAAGFISGYKAAEVTAVGVDIDEAWAAFEQMKPFWRP